MPAGRPASAVLAPPAAAEQAKPVVQVSRRALKNWRVRSRLLLLIIIPTLTAVVLGGTYIVSSWENAVTYQRVVQLANLSSAVTTLAGNLESERDATIQYIAQAQAANQSRLAYGKANPANLQTPTTEQSLTNPWVKTVRQEIGAIGAGYPTQVQNEAQNALGTLGDLTALRSSSLKTELPALTVLTKYTNLIGALLALDDDIALSAGDQQLATNVRALGLVSRIREETSQQQALLSDAYSLNEFAPGVLAALTAAPSDATAKP
jgi:hypothetical protein